MVKRDDRIITSVYLTKEMCSQVDKMADREHISRNVSIPPKVSVSKVIGWIKGKSALMIFDRHPEYREKYNRHFWARGYYCETVGNVNEETIKRYIGEQYERDRMEGDSGK